MSKNVGGRPRSANACPTCGAVPSRQAKRAERMVNETPLPRVRFWYATVQMADRMRELFMYSEQDASAARAAITRDPSLVHTIKPDAVYDWPLED